MLTAVLMAAITVVMMSMVIAVGVRIILQISFGKRFRRFVSRTHIPDFLRRALSPLRQQNSGLLHKV